MDSVLLHESGSDFGDGFLPEVGEQMDAKAPLMFGDIGGGTLVGDQRGDLAQKLVGGILETLAGLEFADSGLAPEFKEPVLGKLFRLGERLLFGADAKITAMQIGRALPVARVLALIDMEFTAVEIVALRHTRTHTRFLPKNQGLCKGCVSVCKSIIY